METVKIMGNSYWVACRMVGRLDSWQDSREFDLLFEKGNKGTCLAAFTRIAQPYRRHDGRPKTMSSLLPADTLLLDKSLSFTVVSVDPMRVTVAMLVNMIKHHLMSPYFAHQDLGVAIEKVIMPLFATGAVDLAAFVADSKNLSQPLLSQVAGLQAYMAEARKFSDEWAKPNNVEWPLRRLQEILHTALMPFWKQRAAMRS